MRQECLLSPTLFNIVFADLERKMSRWQGAQLKMGKEKVWTIANAGNGALVVG